MIPFGLPKVTQVNAQAGGLSRATREMIEPQKKNGPRESFGHDAIALANANLDRGST
jgi:hypothetical protein